MSDETREQDSSATVDAEPATDSSSDAVEVAAVEVEDTTVRKLDWNERNVELFMERNQIKARMTEIDESEEEDVDPLVRRERAQLNYRLDDITARIVQFNFGLVRAYVKKFTSNTSKDDTEDFEAAAVVGLMRAIDTYDMDKGRFGAWAYKPIQREVLRAVRDSDHANMNPGDFERRPDILRALAELRAGNEDYNPTFPEVAAKAGTTVEQVARVLNAPHLESLSVPVGDDGETELGDLIADTTVSVEETVLGGMSLEALQEFGLTALDDRELFVIVRRFGLDAEPEQCLSSIGEMLGLSREAVRQIEAKGLAKIQHPNTLRRLVRHGRR